MRAEELTVHTPNLRLDGKQTTSIAPLFAAGIEKGEAFTPLREGQQRNYCHDWTYNRERKRIRKINYK